MSNPTWRNNLLRHLVGTLDGPAEAEVRAYLDDDDPTTRRLVAESRASVDRLLRWLEPDDSAASLRTRLHERIGRSSSSFRREPASDRVASAPPIATHPSRELLSLRGLTTIAAAIIVIGLAAISVLVADLQAPGVNPAVLATPMSPADEDHNALPDFNSDELLRFVRSCFELVMLQQPTADARHGGRLLWDSTNQICYVFTPQLPPAQDGNTYHLWFTPQAAAPVPVAEFDLDGSGRACIHVDLPEQHTTFASASIRRGPQGDPSRAVNDLLTGTFNQ
jgi:hypothetical protein